jgi:hypothetical protein
VDSLESYPTAPAAAPVPAEPTPTPMAVDVDEGSRSAATDVSDAAAAGSTDNKRKKSAASVPETVCRILEEAAKQDGEHLGMHYCMDPSAIAELGSFNAYDPSRTTEQITCLSCDTKHSGAKAGNAHSFKVPQLTQSYNNSCNSLLTSLVLLLTENTLQSSYPFVSAGEDGRAGANCLREGARTAEGTGRVFGDT